MLHPRKLASALALVLGCAGAAHAGTTPFGNVVVFGDSLSDAGNLPNANGDYTRSTTNPGQVAVQNIADHYHITLTPSRDGGSDYAYGAAGVITNGNSSPLVQTLTQQVDGYLANGAKADPHSLYMVWGGANDIFYHSTQYGVGTIFPGAGETLDQSIANINAAATQELVLIDQLKQAGAKYVVVFNLPDIGSTPLAAQNDQIVPGIKTYLTNVSQSYNQILNAGLGSNTLAVNTYALIGQITADPGKYGFTNITEPACTTSSSHDCDASTLVAADADQTYLFADGVHPTTAAHAMLAQVVESELAAPQQISLLAEAPLAATTVQNETLRSQILKDTLGAERRVFVNIDYAQQRFDGSQTSPQTNSDNLNFTLGYDMRINDNLSAGLAMGVARNDADVGNGGGYRLKDYTGLGYITYHAGGGYLGAYGNYGQSNFGDVNRVFQIGPATTRETGDTDGSHRGLGLTGGWWFGSDGIETGPFATLDWQDVRVDGYSEHGDDATSMWFGDQKRKALVSTLGWRLQGQWQVHNLIMTPYVEMAWSHDSKADPREVSTGLKTMNGSFAITGYTADKNWGYGNIGLSAKLTPTISSWIGYSGRFSDNSQKYNSFNMGFKIGF